MGGLKTKLQKKSRKFENEIKKQLATYLAAAFGFVAGLAWNDAIKALIDYVFPLGSNSILAKFAYALFVTFLIVIVSVYLVKLMKTTK